MGGVLWSIMRWYRYGRDKPVKSVLIRIAGRRGKTDRRGRTHFTLRFRRDAVYRVVASRRNYRTGYALLRAGRGRLRAFENTQGLLIVVCLLIRLRLSEAGCEICRLGGEDCGCTEQ